MSDNRNLVLAIALSIAVFAGWEYFVAMPQREAQQKIVEQQHQARTGTTSPDTTPSAGTPQPGAPGAPAATAAAPRTRGDAIAESPRLAIDTPSLKGSIALKGGRIDDLALKNYRETVEPSSANIVLLSPSGSPAPFYAEFGFVNAAGGSARLPDASTVWTAASNDPLTPASPATLTWDNGEGLLFTRTISVDPNYLFTVTDRVENKGTAAVNLHPYGLVSRHGHPHVSGYYILHEGLIGYLGTDGLQEVKYAKADEEKKIEHKAQTGGWLGITDKYWAAAVVPPQGESFDAGFRSSAGAEPRYQSDYLLSPRTIEPGQSTEVASKLFAGAKEVATVDGYETSEGIQRFELLIDWGWFYFITKPMFWLIDTIYKLVGNFGVAILLVTVIVKLVFFPLANKSYASMSKMKLLQPEMVRIRERWKDDKVKQQQELMELYKKEKINPLAGCLPIVVQIPVFFSLYKVLFVTIEMRHQPFFGWIRDLSAPDPTTVFNLFGLIPWDPSAVPVVGHFLMLGVWPLLMGVSMFIQMRLNPTPPDPTQAMIFNWMPVFFTFMLGSFASGLVIYWTWNNLLSVLQQSVIMRRQGVKIELWDNLKSLFAKKKPTTQS